MSRPVPAPLPEVAPEAPLLLHSLAEFAPLILPCLEAVDPRRVLEIGGEGGLFTRALADWAAERECAVTCVDPFPSEPLRELERAGRLAVVAGKSPGALAGIDPCDVYVVDGDHNHWVVTGELRAIFGAARPQAPPLVVLHDVGWPCARRDLYYDPDDVPADLRQPYTYEGGLVPGDAGVAPVGFSGAGEFAYALEEGGPGNGVLTAVEDFMADRGGLELLRIPCVFGLGFLFAPDAPWAPRVRELLAPYVEHPLLARLEANRMALYVRMLVGEPRLREQGRNATRRLAAAEGELAAARAELAASRLAAAGGGDGD